MRITRRLDLLPEELAPMAALFCGVSHIFVSVVVVVPGLELL